MGENNSFEYKIFYYVIIVVSKRVKWEGVRTGKDARG